MKKELQIINGYYTESMDMYKMINKSTSSARNTAKNIEQQAVKNNEDLFKLNPHTSIYKILDTIDEFKNFN